MSKLCLPFLGLTMFVFAVSPGTATADDKHAASFEACAKACNECQRVCDGLRDPSSPPQWPKVRRNT